MKLILSEVISLRTTSNRIFDDFYENDLIIGKYLDSFDSLDDDESFRSEGRSTFNKCDSIVFLDLRYAVIVEDENHLSPIASPESLEEISKTFLSSLRTKSIHNQTKSKRKLWTSNHEECDDQLPLEEVESSSSTVNEDNRTIKLRIPIPTYLIPPKFRKKQMNGNNGDYSPATGNVFNTPKSIYRKKQLNLITPVPNQICGFLESLDGKKNWFFKIYSSETLFLADIVPNDYCDPNALYYRSNFRRKRDDLVDRLFKLFNLKVFDEKLQNVKVTWSRTRLKTGGSCEYRKRYANFDYTIIKRS